MLKLPKNKADLIKGLSGIIAILLLLSPVFILKNIEFAKNFGYFGYFLSSYFGGSTYILPFIITKLNPFILLIIGTFGNSLDEFFGWYAGGLSLKLDQKTKFHTKIQGFVKKYGVIAIFILGLLPLPQFIYTIAAFSSGHYKMPIQKFFIANFSGKFIRNAVYIIILLIFLT